MSRPKRSAAARGRLTIDVGHLKPAIEAEANKLGITPSEFMRRAANDYRRRELGGVTRSDINELAFYLSNLALVVEQIQEYSLPETIATDLQNAVDLMWWHHGYMDRRFAE